MKKITFKVSKKEGSFVSLLKNIDKISCRIQIDLENNFITAENVDDTMIDEVIELVNQNYNILNVIIENASDEVALVKKCRSEDDLIIQKVEFGNEYVENLINKFMKTAYWAMYKHDVSEKKIGNFIMTLISEISMRYNKNNVTIEYSVGDIVVCNYGFHLEGEINGWNVAAIVCNITNDGMVYLVPVTKYRENLKSNSYLIMNAPDDVVYNKENYTGGIALLDKGKYCRAERLLNVIGKTTPEFFANVLKKLSTTFDFTEMIDDDTKTDLGSKIVESAKNEEKKASVETYASTPKKTKGVGVEESALLNAIGESLEKIDPTKKVEEQAIDFLTDIGMTTSDRILIQSFVIACNIEKINYANVLRELYNVFPKVREEIIMVNLKENFKKWLEIHPELLESCPKISIMTLLKVFAKKIRI